MVIDNDFFKRRNDVQCFLEDNVNVFKVTYFKESGKYYTEEFYELIYDYQTDFWKFPDHFRTYCKDYKGKHAVIEFNEKHKCGYPFLIFANNREEVFTEENGYIVSNLLYEGVSNTVSDRINVGYKVLSRDGEFQGLLDQNRMALWYTKEDSLKLI